MPKVAGALALCKAHPLVFGAVLAVALGIVVYQLVKPKKQKKLKYSNSSGGEDDDSPRQTEFYYYDRETKSVTNDASSNNLRKRHVDSNSSSNINKNEAKPEKKEAVSKEVPPKKKEAVSKEVQTEPDDNNQNDVNKKMLPDKDLDSAMSVNEKVNEYFSRNISGAESIASNDESDSTNSIVKPAQKCWCNRTPHSNDTNDESDSTNSIVKPIKKYCCYCDHDFGENSSVLSSDASSSSWSNVSLTDANSMKKKKKRRRSKASSACSAVSFDSEGSSFTVLSGDSELCRGCEINPVNTYTKPCNHRYMCSDCAPRIFRLFKKCKVCRTKIESIVVEE